MQNAIISDTSCIITLESIDKLKLLKDLYEKVIITEIISNEYGLPLPEFIKVDNPSNLKYQKLLENIVDAGEASAIALCLEMEKPLLIIDDFEGRKLARNLDINITGTLGVLINSKKTGYIKDLKSVLDEVKNKTKFRIKDELVNEALKLAGE